jgi:signal peptidase
MATGLLGMELSRAWLVNSFARRRPVFTIAWVTLFYTLFFFPFSKLTGLHTGQEITRFVGVTFLPSVAENMLASFLAFLGGPLPAIAYRGVLQAFQWFCPLLPDLYWTTQAFLGTVIPAVGFLMVHQLYLGEARQLKTRDRKKENPVGWIAVSIFSVLIIWFSLGLLTFYPSVIISGSMRPSIEVGDLLIMKKVKPEMEHTTSVPYWRLMTRARRNLLKYGIKHFLWRNKKVLVFRGRGPFLRKVFSWICPTSTSFWRQ